LDEIQNDEAFWGDMGTYNWYPGWWNRVPIDNREKLITEIWSNPEIWKLVTESIEGFEHWVGIYTPNSTHIPSWIDGAPQLKDREWALDPHVDKDEGLFESAPTLPDVNPSIGTIFYPWPHKIEGGYLRVWHSQYDSEGNKTADVDYTAPYETIEPKFNRLIIFPNFKEAHAIEPVTKGERRGIAINLWNHRPTTDLKSY
jgi:hypothetical protein